MQQQAHYPIGKRCRALAALPQDFRRASMDRKAIDNAAGGDEDEDDDPHMNHSFLVGTTLLSSTNEMIELEYAEENRALKQTNQYSFFPGELWDLCPHPSHALLLATWASPTEGFGMSIMQGGAQASPVRVAGAEGTRAVAIEQKQGKQFATIHQDGTVKLWNFGDSDTAAVVASSGTDSMVARGTRDLCFDPHNANVLIASGPSGAKLFDVRETMLHESLLIETKSRCLTVDANPNRPHVFLTGGEDGQITFWDARIHRNAADGTAQSLMSFKKDTHEHWVTKARYNPYHDQLVASSSTDGNVNLWRAVSVSSTPLVNLDVDENGDELPQRNNNNGNGNDVLVRTFGDNLDSVYGLAWSAVNAWVFASMSYDGKVKIHNVPSAEKYKILL